MFNIFNVIKKAKTNKRESAVSRVEIDNARVEMVEPKEVKPWYMTRYIDTETGEMHTFDSRDSEAFDKVMSKKTNKLIFG